CLRRRRYESPATLQTRHSTPGLDSPQILVPLASNLADFWMFILCGLYQSLMCFYLPYLLYYRGGFVTMSGLDLNSSREIGVFVVCGTITVVNLYIILNQQHWDWLFLLIVSLSVLSVWIWTGIYSAFKATPQFYQIAAHVFGTLSFWAFTLLMIVAFFLRRFALGKIHKF